MVTHWRVDPYAHTSCGNSITALVNGNAMTKTGAADLIADTLINVLGDAGPRALLAGLFLAALLAFPRLASRCIIPSAPWTGRARPIQFNGVQG